MISPGERISNGDDK